MTLCNNLLREIISYGDGNLLYNMLQVSVNMFNITKNSPLYEKLEKVNLEYDQIMHIKDIKCSILMKIVHQETLLLKSCNSGINRTFYRNYVNLYGS